jgi:hypothetical protein
MDFKRWYMALLVMGYGTTLMAADTAQKQDPIPVDQTDKLFKALQISKADAGVYYVPPSEDFYKRGYIFDDIPREAVITQAHLTEQRMKKEGTFVKVNSRQITYSFMETEDDSLRFSYFPSKGAAMLNWTHAFPITAH